MDKIKLLKKPTIKGENKIDLDNIKKFQVEINPLNKDERNRIKVKSLGLQNKIIKVKGKLGTFSYTAEINIDEIENLEIIDVNKKLIEFMNKNLIVAFNQMWKQKGAEFQKSAKEYYKDDNENQ